MLRYSSEAGSFFSVFIAALVFLLSVEGIAAAQSNTSLGTGALVSNSTGSNNTAVGLNALFTNSTGSNNTATGVDSLVFNSTGGNNTATGLNALFSNTTGNNNTAIGAFADVPAGANLTNARAIGFNAIVNASNKIRLGNTHVTVI